MCYVKPRMPRRVVEEKYTKYLSCHETLLSAVFRSMDQPNEQWCFVKDSFIKFHDDCIVEDVHLDVVDAVQGLMSELMAEYDYLDVRKALLVSDSKPSSYCIVKDRITVDGIQSSGESWIVKAVLHTPIHHNKEVMVKLKKRDMLSNVEHEYHSMETLWNHRPRLFVRPYVLLKGWEKNEKIVFTSEHDEDLTGYCGIVMEKGSKSMDRFLKEKANLRDKWQRIPRIDLISNLVDIVNAAHEKEIVLMDFKPANIVRCFDEEAEEFVWKAIDFDGSEYEGKPIASPEITAEYGAYEVAKYLSSLSTNPSSASSRFVAKNAIDICALGWIAWEILDEHHITLLKSVKAAAANLDNTSSFAILLSRLCELTDDEVKAAVEQSFPKSHEDSIRRFLTDCLKTNPAARLTIQQIKCKYSIFFQTAATMNAEVIANRVVNRIDGLADKLDQLRILLLLHYMKQSLSYILYYTILYTM